MLFGPKTPLLKSTRLFALFSPGLAQRGSTTARDGGPPHVFSGRGVVTGSQVEREGGRHSGNPDAPRVPRERGPRPEEPAGAASPFPNSPGLKRRKIQFLLRKRSRCARAARREREWEDGRCRSPPAPVLGWKGGPRRPVFPLVCAVIPRPRLGRRGRCRVISRCHGPSARATTSAPPGGLAGSTARARSGCQPPALHKGTSESSCPSSPPSPPRVVKFPNSLIAGELTRSPLYTGVRSSEKATCCPRWSSPTPLDSLPSHSGAPFTVVLYKQMVLTRSLGH